MERKHILKAYGAEMVFSDPGEGSDGAIRLCREIYKADPDLYFYPDQYNNPANWKAHFEEPARRSSSRPAAASRISWRHGHQRNLHRQHAPPAQGDLRVFECISVQPPADFTGWKV